MQTSSFVSENAWLSKISAMLELAKIKVVALIAFTAWAGMLLASPPFQADIPLMLEHLPNEEEYRAAGAHIRTVAAQEGVAL